MLTTLNTHQSRQQQRLLVNKWISRKKEEITSTPSRMRNPKNQEVEEAIREAIEIRRQAQEIRRMRQQALDMKIRRADAELKERFKVDGNLHARDLDEKRSKRVDFERQAAKNARRVKIPSIEIDYEELQADPFNFITLRRSHEREPLRFPSHKNNFHRYSLQDYIRPLPPAVLEPKVVVLNEKAQNRPVVSFSKPSMIGNEMVREAIRKSLDFFAKMDIFRTFRGTKLKGLNQWIEAWCNPKRARTGNH